LQNFFSGLGVKPSSLGKTLNTREHKFVRCIARLPKLIIEAMLPSSMGSVSLCQDLELRPNREISSVTERSLKAGSWLCFFSKPLPAIFYRSPTLEATLLIRVGLQESKSESSSNTGVKDPDFQLLAEGISSLARFLLRILPWQARAKGRALTGGSNTRGLIRSGERGAAGDANGGLL
jgi:hypothetical protein